ncbi:TetR/AcrR family transcriptional regulator [Sphingopyxis sp.]|uniref:TetR/AcrR family transcriptional regulator n=1 Tax=Sphingopyxis sp. TaxID=1908224 RepID=UPI0010F86399|nr:TetR/AcrR family transcriptional regulator [Sphingopyxis sp.]MBR2171109.1 TetR/AcrR family transcriptional regulator [Sphingopyxis sp.]
MDSGPAAARTDDNSTQERILRAAYDCFEQYGIAKTTIENIASRAKVSRPTVYKYYPSKDAILDEISVRETWRVNSEVRRRLVRSDDFADFLTDTLLLVIRLANENVYIRRMVESIEFQESVISPSSLMQQLQRTWWTNLFEQARARGEIAADLEIDEIIYWLARAQAMLMLQVASPQIDDAEKRRFIRRFIVQPLLAGSEIR